MGAYDSSQYYMQPGMQAVMAQVRFFRFVAISCLASLRGAGLGW